MSKRGALRPAAVAVVMVASLLVPASAAHADCFVTATVDASGAGSVSCNNGMAPWPFQFPIPGKVTYSGYGPTFTTTVQWPDGPGPLVTTRIFEGGSEDGVDYDLDLAVPGSGLEKFSYVFERVSDGRLIVERSAEDSGILLIDGYLAGTYRLYGAQATACYSTACTGVSYVYPPQPSRASGFRVLPSVYLRVQLDRREQTITYGSPATVSGYVTTNSIRTPNAVVTVGGAPAAVTDATGRFSFRVSPTKAELFKVEAWLDPITSMFAHPKVYVMPRVTGKVNANGRVKVRWRPRSLTSKVWLDRRRLGTWHAVDYDRARGRTVLHAKRLTGKYRVRVVPMDWQYTATTTTRFRIPKH